MQSNFNSLLFFLLCASAALLQVSAHAPAKGAANHGLPRRAASAREQAAPHIHIPLERSQELDERSSKIPALNRISAQVQHLGKKYSQNAAAFKQNHHGKESPVLNVTAHPSTINITETSAGVPVNCTEKSGSSLNTTDNALVSRAPTSGTLSLTPASSYNVWTGYVKIGTPGVDVKVSFDTGSTDFVLNMNQGYTPAKSSSAKKTGNGFTVGYADGTSEKGIIYNDTVSVAGKVAYGQAIGVPTTSTFSESDPGIIGLAFQSVSAFGRRPLLQTLYRYSSIPRQMFAVALSRTASKAEIRIGGYNPAKIKSGSSLTWLPIDKATGFWTTTTARIRMAYGGSTRSVTNRKVILDTGSTLILASTKDVLNFYDKLNVTSGWQDKYLVGVVPTNSAPTLALTMGTQTFTISGDAMFAGTAGNGYSYLSIIGSDSIGLEEGEWLVGDSFFSSVYTVFDADNMRVGFAQGNF